MATASPSAIDIVLSTLPHVPSEKRISQIKGIVTATYREEDLGKNWLGSGWVRGSDWEQFFNNYVQLEEPWKLILKYKASKLDANMVVGVHVSKTSSGGLFFYGTAVVVV